MWPKIPKNECGLLIYFNVCCESREKFGPKLKFYVETDRKGSVSLARADFSKLILMEVADKWVITL